MGSAPSLHPELLALLRCPASQQRLELADPALVERVNARIAAGTLENEGGERVTEPIEGALVREDGRIAYPIREGIPVLLVEEGLPVPAE